MFFDIFSQKVPQKFGGIKKRLYLCIRLRKPSYSHPDRIWRDGRVVDYNGLENRRTERYRGFESLSLRKSLLKEISEGFFIFTLLQLKNSLSFHNHKNPLKINCLSVKGDFYNPIEPHTHRKTVKEPIALITAPYTWS